jgi:signal transduction histidine kinase
MVAYKYQFLDVRSIARYDIYENMKEGIIVFDHNYQIESMNSIVFKTIPDEIVLYESMKIEAVVKAFDKVIIDSKELYKDFMIFINGDLLNLEIEMSMEKDNEVRHYILELKKADLEKGKIVIRILGINRYRKAINKLEEQNISLQDINNSLSEELAVRKQLAITKERNRVSKEVHDVLGHSLTVVISLIEASRMVINEKQKTAKEKLSLAITTTRYNLNQLKESLSNPDEMKMTGDQLIGDIKKMVSSVEMAGTDVDLITRGNEKTMPSHYYDTIYRICQEGLTNAIRHGKAKLITIALRFDNQVDLMIVDNGMGEKNFKKGNGLRYMESKVDELNGYFSCGSLEEEGFSIHITLPLF